METLNTNVELFNALDRMVRDEDLMRSCTPEEQRVASRQHEEMISHGTPIALITLITLDNNPSR